MFQNLLRDVGVLGRLCRLLRAHSMAMRLNNGVSPHPATVNGINTAIANLALNTDNQAHLKVQLGGG